MPDKTDAKNSPRIRDKRKEVDALQAEVDALAIKGRAAGYAPPPYAAHPLADERGASKAAALYGGITGFAGGIADEGEHGYGHLGHAGGWGGPDYASMYAKQKAITREEIQVGFEKLRDQFERVLVHDSQKAQLEYRQRELEKMEELQREREKKIRVDLEYERSVGKKEDIMITTISKIPGYRIKDICGHVMGLGAFDEAGEDDPEEYLLLGPHHARSTALNAMLGEAQVQRANAIIGFEWSTKPLSITRTKIMAQGTAVVIEKDGPVHCGECGTVKKQPKGGGGGAGAGGDKGKAEQHDHLHSHEHDEREDHAAAANANASKQTKQQQQQGKKQKGQAQQQQQQQEGGGKKNKGKQQNAAANNAAAGSGGGGKKGGGGGGAKIDDAENDGEDREKQQPDTDDDNESTGAVDDDGDDTDHSHSYKNNGKQKAQNKQQNQNQNQGGGGKNNKGGPKLNTMQQMIKLLTEAKIREDKASLEAREKEKLLKFMEKYFDDKKYEKSEPSTSDWLRKIEQEIAERKKGGNSKDGKGGSVTSTVGGWEDAPAQTQMTGGWGQPDDDKGKSNSKKSQTNWNDKNEPNKSQKGGKGQKQNNNKQSQASDQQTGTTTGGWDSEVTSGNAEPILQTANVDNDAWAASGANQPAAGNSAWDEPTSNPGAAGDDWT